MEYLLLYILIVFFITCYERKSYGTYITPTNCLTIPTFIVIILIIVISHTDSTIPNFYMNSLVIWIWGTIVFFIPSFFLSIKSTIIKYNLNSYHTNPNKSPLFKPLIYIYIILILIFTLRARKLGGHFGTDSFAEEYAISGLNAHLIVLMTTLTAYFITILDKKNLYIILFIFLSLIPMFAIGTKSWIIAPLIIGLIARIMTGKTKLTLKILIGLVLSMSILFGLSYLFSLLLATDMVFSDWKEFIKYHFLNYLCGGPLACSFDYAHPIAKEFDKPECLFTPIINIFNNLVGLPLTSYYTSWFNLGSLGYGNVRSFLGSVWVHTPDVLTFTVFLLFMSILINVFYCYARKKKNIFITLANCSNLTFLVLGFFDYYWFLLKTYEIFVIYIFLYVISISTFKLKSNFYGY